jgi:hypothetical protein
MDKLSQVIDLIKGKKRTQEAPLIHGVDEHIEEPHNIPPVEDAPKGLITDPSQVTVCVIDNGLFVEMARVLGRTFKKVYYCNPCWVNSFPMMNAAKVGYGFPEIEQVDDFWEIMDDVDLCVFPDIYYGPLQLRLETMGKMVFGARMAEMFEIDRLACKQAQEALGLEVSPYDVCIGTQELRRFLKSHEGVWVKISKWRGHMETFPSKRYKLVESVIDDLEHKLGEFKNIAEFVIEKDIPDCQETGIDTFCIDGEYPDEAMLGIEVKNLGWVGKISPFKKIPEPITRFEKKFSPVFKELGYRGLYSSEVRIDKKANPFWEDTTMRAGSPNNELVQEFWTNLDEIVLLGAQGKLVQPKTVENYKWGAEILIHCGWAAKNWQAIEFPKKFARNIKLRNAAMLRGEEFFVPNPLNDLPEIGAVVGWGNSMKDAIDMAREIAESVEGYFVEVPVESTDKAEEAIEALQKIFPDYLKD